LEGGKKGMKRRLKIFNDPFGFEVAILPKTVVNVTPWGKKVKSGVKDDKGNELPAKTEVQKDACVVGCETPAGNQYPVVVKGSVREVVNEVNNAMKWAEED
jgi:hypothetical protein